MFRYRDLLAKHLALIDAGMYEEALHLGLEGLDSAEALELIDRVLDKLEARREEIRREIKHLEREMQELEKEIELLDIYNKAEGFLENGAAGMLEEVKVI